MSEVSARSQNLLDLYMEALDQYGVACTEMEAVGTSKTHFDPEAAEDRVQKARWEYCRARQRYRHRNSQPQVRQLIA